MFKGRREQQPVRQPVVEEEIVDDEYVNEEFDEVGSGAEDIQEVVRFSTVPVAAEQQQQLSIPKHISQNYIGNRQFINVHVEFVGTPEQFQRGLASTVCKFSPLNSKYFQQNIASKNRSDAGDEHRLGNTRAIVPVAFRITDKQNEAPFAVGFKSEKLEPSTIDKFGAYMFRIKGNTAAQSCNVDVFKPNSLIEEKMYKLGTMCTLEDVDDHIIATNSTRKGKSIGIGMVENGTFSYDTLLSCYRRGMWRDQELEHVEINGKMVPAIFEYEQNPAGCKKTHATITAKMASELKMFLSKEINDVMDRCLDANNIEFTLHRADGQADFNSPVGLLGEVVGNSMLEFPALNEQAGVMTLAPKALSKTYSIGFEAYMEFFPF